MLERLVASGRSRNGLLGTPGAALSAAAHGLLIAGAVVVTRQAPPSPVMPEPTDTIPFYISDPASRPQPAGDPGVPMFPRLDAGDMVGDLVPVPTFDVPDGVEPPDQRAVFAGRRTGPGTESPSLWARPGVAGNPSGPIHAAVADEPPALLTSPAPVYPAMLREAGIEGTVVMEMVVDEEGRPEAETVRVLSSGHQLFEAAARRVVLGARYRPGRWRGRPVRVLIRQPVEFRLTR
jgi:protein TonB